MTPSISARAPPLATGHHRRLALHFKHRTEEAAAVEALEEVAYRGALSYPIVGRLGDILPDYGNNKKFSLAKEAAPRRDYSDLEVSR